MYAPTTLSRHAERKLTPPASSFSMSMRPKQVFPGEGPAMTAQAAGPRGSENTSVIVTLLGDSIALSYHGTESIDRLWPVRSAVCGGGSSGRSSVWALQPRGVKGVLGITVLVSISASASRDGISIFDCVIVPTEGSILVIPD